MKKSPVNKLAKILLVMLFLCSEPFVWNSVLPSETPFSLTASAEEDELPFVSVTLNKSTISAKEIVLGQTVTVNAKASASNCTYAVLYKKKADTKWVTKQYFSTNNTITIKPAKATDYDVCVKVKDSTGKIVKKYFEVKVNEKLANTSTLSAENIVLGQKVTANGSATGGIGKYQYQVFYKQTEQSSWTKVQDFSENAEVVFKPAKATTYEVCVKVKDETGKIEKKYFTVNVGEKLNNTSTISATAIQKGNSVKLNGSATGGAGNYTYAVYYKQYDITHGEGLAIITPRWMKHILSEKTVDRFVKYGVNVFGIDNSLDKFEIAEKAIDETYKFFEFINIPMHLKDVGIDESRIDEMAHHVAVNEGLENAWVPLTEKDIADIFRASL